MSGLYRSFCLGVVELKLNAFDLVLTDHKVAWRPAEEA